LKKAQDEEIMLFVLRLFCLLIRPGFAPLLRPAPLIPLRFSDYFISTKGLFGKW
jgi:hypothetical protein